MKDSSIVRLAKILAISLAVPASGLVLLFFIFRDVQSKVPGLALLDVYEGFKNGLVGADGTALAFLTDASLVAAVVGIALPLMFFVAARICGENRSLTALVFPALVPVSLVLLAALVLVQGAILTGTFYYAESYFTQKVHFIVIGGVGIGAVIGCFGLISSIGELMKRRQITVAAKKVTRESAPRLWEFVSRVARDIQAGTPKNIIVGLEPNFYVTTCDVVLIGENETMTGETLYLSAPLCRMLTTEEFRSVVGHELGHFLGDDTTYSRKFSPVYSGLAAAISNLEQSETGSTALVKLPAIYLLSYGYGEFDRNVARISRQREFKADKVGAAAGSALSLISCLSKLVVYSSIWPRVEEKNRVRLSEGKVSENLSLLMQYHAKYDIDSEKADQILDRVFESATYHPTDTHPPISERAKALELDRTQVRAGLLEIPDEHAATLIDEFRALEKELTVRAHQIQVTLGTKMPDEPYANHFLSGLYTMASWVVTADGKIEASEVALAEAYGMKLVPEFDPIDFRQKCENPPSSNDAEAILLTFGHALDVDDKKKLLRYFVALGEAGAATEQSKEIIQKITNALGEDRGATQTS
jgi:Zn-dependent protease with chaperone function